MHKQLNKLASITLIALITTILSFQAQAKTLANARVAVLDWQAALMESEAVRAELKQASQRFASEESRAKQLSEEARNLQQRLQKDGSIMSEDEKRKLNKQIEEKAQEFQFIAGRLQKQQQEIQQEVVERHRPKLEATVNAVIKEFKIDILLERQVAAFVNSEFDLTEEVAKRLNKK